MEFWGVEVKAGEPLKVEPEYGRLIHISQAAMGEVKNGKGPKKIHLRLKVDGKMYVIGTLAGEERPQILFDLVLHKEFEVSHDWKDGTLYLAGYVADDESYGEEFSEEDSDEEDDMQVDTLQNGKPKDEKPALALAKAKPSEKALPKNVKLENDKASADEDDDSDFGEDSDDDDDDVSDLGEDSVAALKHLIGVDGSDDEDESDDEDDVQDLAPPKKPVQKRPSEAAIESPVSAAKKAKFAAASKKPGVKTPPSNGKSKHQNPKSGGQSSPKPNNKAFNNNARNAQPSKAKGGRK